MQRNKVNTGRVVGALGILLALPLSLPAAADSWRSADDSVRARWNNYALASITPAFHWAARPREARAPDVRDQSLGVSGPAWAMGDASAGALSLTISHGQFADSPGVASGKQGNFMPSLQPALQRTVVTPSYSIPLGPRGTTQARLSAVLAYQRFANPDMGLVDGREPQVMPLLPMGGENSYGRGARLDIQGKAAALGDWHASYQSRVDMDALSRYRGMLAEAGDFDIPARWSVGLSRPLSSRLAVDIAADHVHYSQLAPFTSAALPRRFIALLGSGASPNFAWRDLTVYSVGWTLRDAGGTWQLRYTTRQQPLPTSQLLRNALDEGAASGTVSLGWSLDTGPRSRLSVLGNYASAPYVLGLTPYRHDSDSFRRQLELQAQWSVLY